MTSKNFFQLIFQLFLIINEREREKEREIKYVHKQNKDIFRITLNSGQNGNSYYACKMRKRGIYRGNSKR